MENPQSKSSIRNSGNGNAVKFKLTHILKKFMLQKDIPGWFRGLSVFQINAAESLINCIRDDTQQGTCYRVKRAISVMGLSPLISSEKVKLVMKLCRGNDLAFLWFIMELYYSDTCKNCQHPTYEYNVNEQIILSCIAHLDMITTLRELDKVLPRQPKQKQLPRATKSAPKRNQLPSAIKSAPKPAKKKYVLPYFEPLTQPIPRPKQTCFRHSHGSTKFGDYNKYKDEKHVVCNEMNRWYAKYQLSHGQRIVKKLISDNVFPATGSVTDARELRHSQAEYRSSRVGAKRSLVSKRVVGRIITEQIEQTVKPDNIQPTKIPRCAHHQGADERKEFRENVNILHRKELCSKHFDIGFRKNEAVIEEFRNVLKNTKEIIDEKSRQESCTEEHAIKLKSVKNSNSIKFDSDYLKRYDYGYQKCSLSTPADRFFDAPQPHRPFKFNYDAIFIPTSSPNPIETNIVKALAENTLGAKKDEDEAIIRSAKDMWCTTVKTWEAKHEAERKQKANDEETISKRYKYNLPFYNPRDSKLMENMLINALREMREDPKFVLASLPDCHKIPVLREWIRARFGFKYTREEKQKSLLQSKRIFYEIRKRGIPVPLPQLTNLGTKQFVSYKCHDRILKKTKKVLEDYYHNCKVAFMESVRVFWGASQPFQCSAGPPRATFYAYMPSKFVDICLFRPFSSWINIATMLQVITKGRSSKCVR